MGLVEYGYLCLIFEYSIDKDQNKNFIAIYTHLSLLQIPVQRIVSISVRRGLNVALIARRSTFSLPSEIRMRANNLSSGILSHSPKMRRWKSANEILLCEFEVNLLPVTWKPPHRWS